MPSYGGEQKPAGKKICTCGKKKVGTRIMKSNNTNIIPLLKRIDNIPYKGNPVLNANK